MIHLERSKASYKAQLLYLPLCCFLHFLPPLVDRHLDTKNPKIHGEKMSVYSNFSRTSKGCTNRTSRSCSSQRSHNSNTFPRTRTTQKDSQQPVRVLFPPSGSTRRATPLGRRGRGTQIPAGGGKVRVRDRVLQFINLYRHTVSPHSMLWSRHFIFSQWIT